MKSNPEHVKPYVSDDDTKKEQVQRMFDSIAPKYDLLNRLLSLGIDRNWRKVAVSKLSVVGGDQLLDIATGTGDLAFEISRTYPTKQVTGLDLAEGMLSIAREKSKAKGFENQVTFIQGDSENLPFESNSYDGATVAFGVRNFGDLNKGLTEIHRVLRDGGRIVVLEFTKPTVFPLEQLFGFYFKHILPRIGGMTSGDSSAYRYLYDSVQAFPDFDLFNEQLVKAGFSKPKYEGLSFGICAVYTAEK